MPQFVRGSDGRIYEIQDSGDGAGGVFAIIFIAAMMAAYNAYLWLLSHYVFVACITIFGFITWVGWVYHEYQQGEAKNAIGKKIISFLLILVGFGLAIQGYSREIHLKEIPQTTPQNLPAMPVQRQPTPPKRTIEPMQQKNTNSNPVATPTPPANYGSGQSTSTTGYVKTMQGSPLRMRTSPADTAKIVIMITNGEAVTILGYGKDEVVLKGEKGRWCNIRYGRDEGWAWGKFIVPNK